MSRPLRIELEGAWHHVMNRGRRGESVFEGRDEYGLFLDLLKEISQLWDARIAAFCLMPNHYHRIIHTPQEIFPDACALLTAFIPNDLTYRIILTSPCFGDGLSLF
jgi:REP element-mobilizing transposase RayT